MKLIINPSLYLGIFLVYAVVMKVKSNTKVQIKKNLKVIGGGLPLPHPHLHLMVLET